FLHLDDSPPPSSILERHGDLVGCLVDARLDSVIDRGVLRVIQTPAPSKADPPAPALRPLGGSEQNLSTRRVHDPKGHCHLGGGLAGTDHAPDLAAKAGAPTADAALFRSPFVDG